MNNITTTQTALQGQPAREAALKLASQGFHVFPIEPGSKLPAIKAWPDKATRDPEQIRKWWTCPVMEIPIDRNIGITTGKFGDDKALVVVDVDVKAGKQGNRTLLEHEIEGRLLPKSWEAITASGGQHLIYIADKPVKQGVDVLGPGLDIRSGGGYIVAPGSCVGGKEYKWRYGPIIDPEPVPQWIVEKCGAVKERSVTVTQPPVEINRERAQRRAIEYLEDFAPEAYEGAGGDSTTFRVAAQLKDIGVDEITAVGLMAEHWNERCLPPWDIEDLEVKVGNAYRYGKEAPGSDAPEVDFAGVEIDAAEDDKGVHPLRKLNEQYAFLTAGSGHVVLWETTDDEGNTEIRLLKEATFHRRLAANKITFEGKKGPKTHSVSKLWLEWKGRRSYDGLSFRPGEDAPDGFYNPWRGWAVEPSENGSCERFKDHLLSNVCGGSRALYNWLFAWFAQMIQEPMKKSGVAVVLRGGQGVGKSIVGEIVGSLFPSNHVQVANQDQVTGKFNALQAQCLLLQSEEAFFAGDKRAAASFKNLITNSKVTIEAKGVDAVQARSCLRLLATSNEDWVVPAAMDDRRFAVFNVGSARRQDRAYFGAMLDELDNGGRERLLWELKNFDWTAEGADPFTPPKTEAALEQKIESLPPIEAWWFEKLQEGALAPEFDGIWPGQVSKAQILDEAETFMKSRGTRYLPTRQAIGRVLKQLVPDIECFRPRKDNPGRRWLYKLPSLADCRASFDALMKQPYDWPDDADSEAEQADFEPASQEAMQ